MKLKQILLIISVFAVSFGAIAQTKITNASRSQSQALTQKLQTLEQNTQEEILLIQTDIQTINNSIDEIKKATIANTTLIQDTTDKTHKHITVWFAVLAGVITFISIACPLIVNISYQKYYFDKQVKQLKEDILFIKGNIESTQNNADSAKESLLKINELEKIITTLKDKIEKSEIKATRAAKRALVSKFFTEALAEHDKNPHRAIDLYTKVINIDNLNADAYNNRGVLYKQVGHMEEALKDYNKAIELNSNDADVFNNRGNLYKELGDTKKALEDYNKAIELNPTDADIYNNKANLYLEIQQFEKALENINHAIVLNSSKEIYYITRGEIYLKIKKYQDAIFDFHQAITLKKDAVEAYIHRAECYRKLANRSRNKTKKAEYIALAELDDAKINQLKNKND